MTSYSHLSNDSVETLFLTSSKLQEYEAPYTNPPSIVLLGVVYTMENEVVPRLCKIYDWLLNSAQEHLCLHQGKNVRVTMEFEVSRRHYPSTLSNEFCNGRGKKGAMVEKGMGTW